jgi:isoleucyl-tRNA synthetase
MESAGSRFVGKNVLGEGNEEVLRNLKEAGALLFQENYAHKYPYDWRTKKPVILR